jgi:hypothetical protein
MPDSVLALTYGLSRRTVSEERYKRKIPLFKGYLLTQEGENCRSLLEAMYDAYLHDKNIVHQHEAHVPNTSYIADYLIDATYFEIAGMTQYIRYREKLEKKKQVYQDLNIPVVWIEPDSIKPLFATCKTSLKVAPTRICKDCGIHTYDIVKGYCRENCYMKHWRKKGITKLCLTCGKAFTSNKGAFRSFCSHKCYSESMELKWPSWDDLKSRLKEKSIRQVAFDLGIKPSSLYMHIRRAKIRGLF